MPTSIPTASIALGGVVLGILATLAAEWLRHRWDQDARSLARRQALDDLQRDALLKALNAGLDWTNVLIRTPGRPVLSPQNYGEVAERHRAALAAAQLEFMKAVPRIRDPNVRQVATEFQVVAVGLSWGQDTQPDDLMKAEERLVAAIEQEVQRYLWPLELRPADLGESAEGVKRYRMRIRNRQPGA